MPDKLTTLERSRFTICKQTISDGLQTCFDTGSALIEIRDRKYYREDFETFEEFCSSTYQIGRSQAYRLIDAAEVKDSLPKSVAKLVTNESQARALIDVPEAQRAEVILEVKKSGEAITAEAIREASPKPKMSPIGDTPQPVKMGKSDKAPVEIRDRTGYLIPAKLHAEWQAVENELGAITAKISSVRSEVRKAMESNGSGLAWRRVSANAVMVALDNAYREVNAGIPFAVCPYCQGMITKTCTACKGIGFIGKFDWQTAIPKELIAIREKACKK